MTPVLGMRPNAPTVFLSSYKSAISYLSSNSANTNTSVFYGLYIQEDFSVKQSFADKLKTYYNVEVHKFSNSKKAAEDINTAVAETTNNLINDIVSEKDLEKAELVLVSALYFKAAWLNQFSAVDSKPKDFLTSRGYKKVQMMSLKGEYLPYIKIAGKFDAISLTYKDTDYSMIALRPLSQSMSAVQTMLNALSSVDLAQLTSDMRTTRCNVQMPRFEIRKKYLNLKSVFQSMGVKRVFSDKSDLSGMAFEPLKIDKIILEVFMNVTEAGTEAAAAAVILITTTITSWRPPPPKPLNFHLDRPFVAVVWNSKHNMSLFEAYVGSP